MEHKKTIYFLEWIAQESGFTIDQILENMRPENQKWESPDYLLINDFYKNKDDACRWVGKLFFWEGSFLNQEYQFWDNIYMKWSDLVDSKRYNIEFSRYPIENWELIKPVETIKVKEKKLKI